MSPHARETKAKITKWNYIKLLHSEGNYQQMKRLPTEWEKICANDTSYKWLISKIYKELIQLNFEKTNNLD